MKRVVFLLLLSLSFTACKSKKEKRPGAENATFFPVPAYVRGELARLDSSMFSFTKIETENGESDTVSLRSKEVRQFAQDFLDLPDISAAELKDDYEVTHLYDDLQEAFVFTYITKEDHPVQQQNVTVEPLQNNEGKNDIKSIYVNLAAVTDGVPVKKRLLWTAGKSFLVTTIKQPLAGPEQIHTVQISWNGFDRQKVEK